MRYERTGVAGAMIVDVEPHRDDRGFLSSSFSADEFAKHGMLSSVVQTNICYNYARGTVRGMHRQVHPYPESKLVRCTRGEIADVAVDVRRESHTYGKHVMVRLSADNHRALFVPPYVAHGFQTLADNTEVLCLVSGCHTSADEQGFRWDDPQFGIEWPLPGSVISEDDANWPLLQPVGTAAL